MKKKVIRHKKNVLLSVSTGNAAMYFQGCTKIVQVTATKEDVRGVVLY
jgi:hypothetical protein